MVYVVDVKAKNKNEATKDLMAEKSALQSMVLGRERGEATLINYFVENTKILDNRCKFYQK